MKKNTRLTLSERKIIESLIKKNFKCTEISRRINRGKNSVVVEVRRAGGYDNYNAKRAQKESEERWAARNKNLSEYNGSKVPEPNLLRTKIQNLEFQIEILFEQIKELRNENK